MAYFWRLLVQESGTPHAAMLQCALVNIYDKNHDSPASLEIPCIDLWRPYARPMAVGQIPQHVHYDSWEGEYPVVWIGTQLWFRVEDISYCTHFSPAVVMQMAGKERTLKLPDSKVYPLFDTGGEKAYVRADAVERLIAAMPQRPYATDQFVIRIIKAYRAPQRRWMYDESVKASTLHRMLGAHLDFKVWSSEMLHKHHKLICADNSVCSWGDDEDFKISLHLALDMAAKEGTFAGDITALLLTDSGYLHGGPIDETPDASLERFVGLVPDRHGRVQIRKLWELSNTEESFEDWYQGTPMPICCRTSSSFCLGTVISFPSRNTCPLLTLVSRLMQRSRVLFPVPLGPMMTMFSPRWTSREISLKIMLSP